MVETDQAREIVERLELLEKQVELLRASVTARLGVLKAALVIVALKTGIRPDGELGRVLGAGDATAAAEQSHPSATSQAESPLPADASGVLSTAAQDEESSRPTR